MFLRLLPVREIPSLGPEPSVYLLAGAAVVVFVISRWRKRGMAAEATAGSAKAVSPEILERARALARKATEE